jgi:hypothetical protein
VINTHPPHKQTSPPITNFFCSAVPIENTKEFSMINNMIIISL